MKTKLLFLILLLTPLLLQAEEEQASPFEEIKKPGSVRTYLEFPQYSFYLGAPNINGGSYQPNSSFRFGATVMWKGIGIGSAISLPMPQEEIDRRGKSDQFNAFLSRYWRNYGVLAYYQGYRGFYISNPLTEIDTHKPDKYPQLPDAEVKNYGLILMHVLDESFYSLKASFSQKEIQNHEGGSFLMTAFYNHLDLSMGNKFIRGTDPDSQQSLPDVRSATLDTAGAGGGYGHTWIFNKNFLTAQALVSLGIQKQSISTVNDQESRLAPAAKFNGSLSAGHRFENSVLGLQGLADTMYSSTQNTEIYSTMLSGFIYYTMLF